ncbi:MAG: hypothetical protein R3B47_02915 [Bacteroidia bacterium]
MKKIFYTLIAILIALPAFAQQSSIDVLYVANNDPADGGDKIVSDSLAAIGYNVTVIPAAGFDEFFCS